MNACEENRNRLLLEQSGEYAEGPGGPLASHLAACPACRRFQADAVRLFAIVPLALETDAPARIRKIRTVPPLAPVLRLFLARPLAAAGLAAALLAGILLGLTRGPAPTTRTEPAAELADARGDRLHEWHYWVAAGLSDHEEEPLVEPLSEGWTVRELAHHLLVLQGFWPESEWLEDEEPADATPGALPPITIQDRSIPGLLRS